MRVIVGPVSPGGVDGVLEFVPFGLASSLGSFPFPALNFNHLDPVTKKLLQPRGIGVKKSNRRKV